ncbi:MAG: hypothetical protein KJ057_13200 [Phycisphaerae bacterium]|nr:MAG: hypothetical protein EDS66_14315 [Planctomycetota bacterium]KAB2946214.1 MAG: hypothetical protein F9K17_08845 [Phycisphaerae bacterium]MBE7455448.1 hypothetical protein [Planctomycetia bacterium]MCK6464954.1 hypothetical protein [Phycisphaerae bacterium]MCL4719421.1 hypothetical protein [Phycisphaerae bacterium]
MKRFRFLLAWAPLCAALLIGCERGGAPEDGKPSATATTASTASGTSPIEDYRKERMKEAMRGLRYEKGYVELDPEQAPAIAEEVRNETYEGLLSKGRTELDSGLSVEAIGTFTRAVIHSPQQAPAYEALGDALITKGRVNESQAAYTSAMGIADDSAELRFKVAQNIQRGGDLDGQIAAYGRVIELDPNHAEAHSRIAIAYYYKEEYAAAWTHTHEAERLGGVVPPQFRGMLSAKLAEPAN